MAAAAVLGYSAGTQLIGGRKMKDAKRFVVEAVIPATPDVVCGTWLSSAGHAAMTRAPAEHSAEVGAEFSAWGGYIFGRTLEVHPTRIVQAWRTLDFADDEADSRVTIELSEAEGGTCIRITHEDLPPHGGQYEQGWVDHYFTPMRAHFGA